MKTVLGYLRPHARRVAVGISIKFTAAILELALPLLLAMGCGLEAVLEAEAPVAVMFRMLDMGWLRALFEVVLFGTLIETAAGFIKAAADRAEAAWRGNGALVRLPAALGLAAAGLRVSALGLGNLVERGYGAAGRVFLVLYALPMLTVGVRKILRASSQNRRRGRFVIFRRPGVISILVKRRRLW